MRTKKITFEYFRYQLIPKSSHQYNLFGNNISLEELKQRKNDFFKDVLLNDKIIFTDSYHEALRHKILFEDEEFIVLQLGRKKDVILSNENFEDETYADFPSVLVLINNNPDSQRIAISTDYDAFSSTFVVANILEYTLSRFLSEYNIEMMVSPILDELDFWKLIDKYENRITQLQFNLIKPNLANISGTFKNEIRELGDSTNSIMTKVELNAPKDGTLENINENNHRIKALADYAIQGGSQYIHMKVKGVKKVIKTEKTISKTTIDEIEIAGEIDTAINVYKEIIKEAD